MWVNLDRWNELAPDLQYIVGVLGPAIAGRRITGASVKEPVVIRTLLASPDGLPLGFASALEGRVLGELRRPEALLSALHADVARGAARILGDQNACPAHLRHRSPKRGIMGAPRIASWHLTQPCRKTRASGPCYRQ